MRSGTGGNVSITTPVSRPKITTSTLQDKKQRREPITSLTAYDFSSARLVDEAGIDVILVGDSLGMVMLGYESTLPVTMDDMLHHVRAVRRGVQRGLLVADMPFASYHVSNKEGLHNAARLVKEAGAEAVKIEGGQKRVNLIRRLIEAEIPVFGHIGLTPQSVNTMGGYKVQGKTLEAIDQLMRDATSIDRAGATAMYLEGIPREVAAMITAEVKCPTIGIGAGPDCDGQVLVLHDILNLTFAPPAKFVRRYGDAAALITNAVTAFKHDVETRAYPSDAESYHLPKDARAAMSGIGHKHGIHLKERVV
ncbi:MAG: 3-methyl-2-oxobutanoate hydroxymethyltransferase [Acidobacteriaceae bacterium]|nr:3-methyl-2-oxobutanoate hydroxymethyltransferase [Acidobacteriaceae bacterium]